MKPEATPLTEVARYLPREAAQLLMSEPADIQMAVLEVVRAALVVWDETGKQLDPISLDTALCGFIPPLIQIMRILNTLSSRLNAADILIESLGRSLAQIAKEAREA